MRQLLGEIAQKGIPMPPAVVSSHPRDGGGGGGGGGGLRVASGFHAEVLRAAVDVRGMMTRLQVSLLNDYQAAMHHTAMQPYVGHEAVWGVVSRFSQEAYRWGRAGGGGGGGRGRGSTRAWQGPA